MPAAACQRQGSFTFRKHQHPRTRTRAEHHSCKESASEIQICRAPPALGTGERDTGPPASDQSCPGKGTKPPVPPFWGSTAGCTAAALPGWHSSCHPGPLGCPNSLLVSEPSPRLGSNWDSIPEQRTPSLPRAVLHRGRARPLPAREGAGWCPADAALQSPAPAGGRWQPGKIKYFKHHHGLKGKLGKSFKRRRLEVSSRQALAAGGAAPRGDVWRVSKG